jgi:hypothetical protein
MNPSRAERLCLLTLALLWMGLLVWVALVGMQS